MRDSLSERARGTDYRTGRLIRVYCRVERRI